MIRTFYFCFFTAWHEFGGNRDKLDKFFLREKEINGETAKLKIHLTNVIIFLPEKYFLGFFSELNCKQINCYQNRFTFICIGAPFLDMKRTNYCF